MRYGLDLDQHIGPEEPRDLDSELVGGWAVFTNSSRTARIVASSDTSTTKMVSLTTSGQSALSGHQRAADVRERRPCLFLPAVREVPVGVDRHLAGGPHEAAGWEGNDVAVAVRPRKIAGRGRRWVSRRRTHLDLGKRLVGFSAGSSSCRVRASK